MHSNPDAKPQGLAQQHTPSAIAARLAARTRHNYVGDFVLGAVDGTVTTFAIVSATAGAGLSTAVAIVLGLSNVLADGFSMAVSNFLKSRSDQQLIERYRRMEEAHVREIPDGEREEIRQIFAAKGFEGRMLEDVVAVITEDRRRWVDTMLTEEWGLQLDTPSPGRAAATTFLAFVLAGMTPLLPLLAASWLMAQQVYLASALLAGASFFATGVARGQVTGRSRWAAGAETLLIGGSAASLAFAVGAWLRPWAGG